MPPAAAAEIPIRVKIAVSPSPVHRALVRRYADPDRALLTVMIDLCVVEVILKHLITKPWGIPIVTMVICVMVVTMIGMMIAQIIGAVMIVVAETVMVMIAALAMIAVVIAVALMVRMIAIRVIIVKKNRTVG